MEQANSFILELGEKLLLWLVSYYSHDGVFWKYFIEVLNQDIVILTVFVWSQLYLSSIKIKSYISSISLFKIGIYTKTMIRQKHGFVIAL